MRIDSTLSYGRRHTEDFRALHGVWRWLGMQQFHDEILSLIVDRRTIDFGGALGPLGYGSIVVDLRSELKTLADVPGQVDTIFSSHCLEHVEFPEVLLEEMAEKLRPGGSLVLQVPAWTREDWRAGWADVWHPDDPQPPHLWTCGLSTDILPESLPSYVAIDTLVSHWFSISVAEHCGDHSILVIGQREG